MPHLVSFLLQIHTSSYDLTTICCRLLIFCALWPPTLCFSGGRGQDDLFSVQDLDSEGVRACLRGSAWWACMPTASPMTIGARTLRWRGRVVGLEKGTGGDNRGRERGRRGGGGARLQTVPVFAIFFLSLGTSMRRWRVPRGICLPWRPPSG